VKTGISPASGLHRQQEKTSEMKNSKDKKVKWPRTMSLVNQGTTLLLWQLNQRSQ
jgi:hypothetical protein